MTDCFLQRAAKLTLQALYMLRHIRLSVNLSVRPSVRFLQCFDTVGLVIWPVKIVPEVSYYVSSGTLNPTHSPMSISQ